MPDSAPRDRWDKAEIIFKGISSVLMPLTIALLGYFGNKYIQERQTQDARNRLQTELMSKREESESALRKDMFKSIIDSFLTPQRASTAEKMLNLQLLTYNFYESFNLKPLFAHFDEYLRYRMTLRPVPPGERRRRERQVCGDESRDSLEVCRAMLYELAQFIAGKQRLMLEQVGKKFDMTLKLKELKEQSSVFLNEATFSLVPKVEWKFRLDALDNDLTNKRIRVQLSANSSASDRLQSYEFWVEPFDFPIIDNVRLSNDERFAVLITSFDDKQGIVELTALYFPGTYSSLKEKPALDEAINRLVH